MFDRATTQFLSPTIRNYILVSGLTATIVFFAIWCGIFFGINLGEIQRKDNYIKTEANVTNQLTTPYNSCSESCSCSYCYSKPTCMSYRLKPPGYLSEQCCGGEYCCRECCEKCEDCDRDGRCITYNCRCTCCEKVSESLCTISCSVAYMVSVVLSYQANNGKIYNRTIEKDCGSSATDCIKSYFQQYPLGSKQVCFYDPKKPETFILSVDYSNDAFAAMIVFGSLTLLVIIGIVLFMVLRTYIQWKMKQPPKTSIKKKGNLHSEEGSENGDKELTTLESQNEHFDQQMCEPTEELSPSTSYFRYMESNRPIN